MTGEGGEGPEEEPNHTKARKSGLLYIIQYSLLVPASTYLKVTGVVAGGGDWLISYKGDRSIVRYLPHHFIVVSLSLTLSPFILSSSICFAAVLL